MTTLRAGVAGGASRGRHGRERKGWKKGAAGFVARRVTWVDVVSRLAAVCHGRVGRLHERWFRTRSILTLNSLNSSLPRTSKRRTSHSQLSTLNSLNSSLSDLETQRLSQLSQLSQLLSLKPRNAPSPPPQIPHHHSPPPTPTSARTPHSLPSRIQQQLVCGAA